MQVVAICWIVTTSFRPDRRELDRRAQRVPEYHVRVPIALNQQRLPYQAYLQQLTIQFWIYHDLPYRENEANWVKKLVLQGHDLRSVYLMQAYHVQAAGGWYEVSKKYLLFYVFPDWKEDARR